MIALPAEYIDNIKKLFGDDFESYLNCFENERVYGLRVNTDKISVADFLSLAPFRLEPVPWCADGFYVDIDSEPSKHPYYHAGLYYLQEPSAMLPAASLPVSENDVVFDCCAAPGGKSDELLNKLKESGVLFSNDISASRCKGLLRNIEKHGSTRTLVISEDITEMDDRFNECFDRILVDAPCSGEGMFRKDRDLIKAWNPDSNDYYQSLQKKIADRAVCFLKNGGMMVYSTCTFSPKENEDVIEYLLNRHPELSVVKLPLYEGFSEGRIPGTVRLYPHRIKGEGHFVALLKKGEGIETGKKKHRLFRISEFDEEVREFFRHISREYYDVNIERYGDALYLVPETSMSLKGIRVLRSGLLIGEMKRGRFEPSQALAVSLKKEEFDQSVEIGLNDAQRYLRGETLMVESPYKGYVLVCLDGYPLGFGKISNGTLNNKIDKGWRRL